MFTKEFIDKVKKAVDILDLVSRYTDLHLVGDNIYGGLCPHPLHDDTDPSFTIFAKDQSWCCYGCHHGTKEKGHDHSTTNYGSDCFAFLQWINNGTISWREAVLTLAEEYGVSIETDKNAKIYKQNLRLTYSLMKNVDGEVLNYLKSRGIEETDRIKFLIGFDGEKIVFPLLDKYKRVVGFSRRWLNPPEKCRDKYRNSKTEDVFDKSSYFYGIHLLDNNIDSIYITEGATDVILGHKYGVPNLVATLGTSFTDSHVEVIKQLKKEPIFLMDNDKAGNTATFKAIKKLEREGINSKIVTLEKDTDLADASLKYKDGLMDFINKNTYTFGYYLIRDYLDKYNKELSKIRLDLYPKISDAISNLEGEEKESILDLIYEQTKINMRR